MDRREFLKTTGAAALGATLLGSRAFSVAPQKPNIIIIMADDLGYGDIGCYGSKAIKTPNIDRLAGEGVRLTSFFSSAAVCSPSRCGLLTGRYPPRAGVTGVYFPSNNLATPLIHGVSGIGEGMNPNEIISAQLLRDAGYKTCCVGKWHLGDKKPYRPNHRGFDHYMGLHYSNDMVPLPLYRNDRVIEKDPVNQAYLTQKYTREALKWLDENHEGPFFLYLPHTFPHVPLYASPEFRGRSAAGLYGDTVEEIDWSTGEVLKALDRYGITDNTFVFFTSDNGPWFQGSPGGHRGRKAEIFDGGMRVPGIARWPGVIPAGSRSDEMAMNIDLFSTALSIAGAAEPSDRIIDGRDILPMLKSEAPTPHEAIFFYDEKKLHAVRTNRWKYHRRHTHWTTKHTMYEKGPVLFDLEHDRDESYNVIGRYPEAARKMEKLMNDWETGFVMDVPG